MTQPLSDQNRSTAGLFLVAMLDAKPGICERVLMVLDRIATPSLLLSAPPQGPLPEAAARDIVLKAQARGVAALVADDIDLARRLGADGVHLRWRKTIVGDYRDARQSLGRDIIIGADAGRSRHDAMTLGEDGADYVGFGAPPHLKDRETARERRYELIAWWAEIVEVPVVALDIETPEEAREVAMAGADFLALTLPDAQPDPLAIDQWIASIKPLFAADQPQY